MSSKKKLVDQNLNDQLRKLYKTIINLPENSNFLENRKFCANEFLKIFSNIKFILKGTENLPYESNSIFIYNHLNNHQNYSVFDDFQITLDSHFISSIILEKYYKNPGNRVVRCSLEEEKNHFKYYEKFNYIRVFAQNFIPPNINYSQIKIFNKNFYRESLDDLKKGNGIVVSPEGFSRRTEESPGDFKIGVFKLATKLKNQPKIVPIIMANFDKLVSESTYKCEIMKPFKMSDYGIYDGDDPRLIEFVKDYNKQYKSWVKNLILEDLNFEAELKELRKLDTEKIEEINSLIKAESKVNNKLIQLDFYHELMRGNKINSDFYLQDGLHLNNKGYQILIKKLKELIKNLD